MPCRTDPIPPTSFEIEAKKNREFRQMAEPLLCSACRALENLGFDFDLNPELSRWWDNHKKEDEARIQAEAKKKFREKRALQLVELPVLSLTDDDIKLLREEGYL